MLKSNEKVPVVDLISATGNKFKSIYAIGDIHGSFDDLELILRRIELDRQFDQSAETAIVFLGDYIDRGPRSVDVVKRVLKMKAENTNVFALRGNHEEMAIGAMFHQNRELESIWMNNGGVATINSYSDYVEFIGKGGWEHTESEMHSDFEAVDQFPYMYRALNAVFVHAGISPYREIDDQIVDDVLWIRGTFHRYTSPFPDDVFVVHGHTPGVSVNIYPNRINLDSGAVFGLALSFARLDLSADKTRYNVGHVESWRTERKDDRLIEVRVR